MEFLFSKCPVIIKIYLWYYRLLQTTFGGLTIDSNGQLATNKYLKYYGFITGLFITATDILGLYLVIHSNFIDAIYTSGYIFTYYFTIIYLIIEKIRVFFNLWYLQFNGIEFFKIFFRYKVEKRKSLYLLFTLWISHILIPLAFGVYQLLSPHELISKSMVLLMILQKFGIFSVTWSVSFLMWNISVHAFENLVNMRKVLIKSIDRISGNNQTKFAYFNSYFFI
jgi:phage-related holin